MQFLASLLALASATYALPYYYPGAYPPYSGAYPPYQSWWNGYNSQGPKAQTPYLSYDRCETRYDYNTELLNWDSARLSCMAKGGQLAKVTSQLGTADFRSRFGNALAKKDAWIGASERDRKGLWQWDNGFSPKEPVYYTNWARREPKWGKQYVAYCLLLTKYSLWEAEDCSENKPYICEYTVCGGSMVLDDSSKDDSENEEQDEDDNNLAIPKDQDGSDSESNDIEFENQSPYVNDEDPKGDRGEYKSVDSTFDASASNTTSTVEDASATSVNASRVDEDDVDEKEEREEEEEVKEEVSPQSPEAVLTNNDLQRRSNLRLLEVLLQHIGQLQRTRRPCLVPPPANGIWNCNHNSSPWLCILDCGNLLVAGDGVVDESGVPRGDGVIVCYDGLWSRDDFYCAAPKGISNDAISNAYPVYFGLEQDVQ